MLNNSYYLIYCFVWLLTVFLYIPIFSVLYSSRWKASDYTHAYFILPLLYLLLLVPIPIGIIDDITLPLRYGISVVTEVALKSFHYPVGRKGLLLFIGDNELFMGQPCSGFRSLVTMFSLGLVYVYTARGAMLKKGILGRKL